MLFNSIEFLIFLPTVFFFYWFVASRNLKLQNLLVLIASYIFYGWWDWRFLSLLAFSTIVDYWVGLRINQVEKKSIRKIFLLVSLTVNLGLLGFFKYFNFFSRSWAEAWGSVGIHVDPIVLNIILPVGISFYTFQTLSYSIDIYKGHLKPTKDFIAFAAFVSFFPQLVAGPIERASNLLPQIIRTRTFDYQKAVNGINFIIIGLFKKVVIADNLSPFVDQVFANPNQNPIILIIGAIAFGIQIYGDFSGYSDIAIGVAALFGFQLMTNFNFPYFSTSIPEFWKKWHISLSTWFRDYLYIPIGGSKVSFPRAIFNVFVIFLVSGFWHGANWTFIVWGAIHAVLFIPGFIKKHKGKLNKSKSRIGQIVAGIGTFAIVTVAWVFFRADSVGAAATYLRQALDFRNFSSTAITAFRIDSTEGSLLEVFIPLLIFVLVELFVYKKKHQLNLLQQSLLVLTIIYMGNFFNPASFIYFQF